jgi:hypothetical protein
MARISRMISRIDLLCGTRICHTGQSHIINYFINTRLEIFSRTRKMMALSLSPLDSRSNSESEIDKQNIPEIDRFLAEFEEESENDVGFFNYYVLLYLYFI